MSKSLSKQPNQYTVAADGEVYVSQVEAAHLVGLPRTTVRDWINKSRQALVLNDFNQLSELIC